MLVCKHPAVSETSLVNGREIYGDCSWLRTCNGQCGPQAKLFKPKEPNQLGFLILVIAAPVIAYLLLLAKP